MLNTGSTYCNDPDATHIVEASGEKCGYGIYGYYTSEFAAHSAARRARAEGGTATVKPYDRKNPTKGWGSNVHPLIEANMRGYA